MHRLFQAQKMVVGFLGTHITTGNFFLYIHYFDNPLSYLGDLKLLPTCDMFCNNRVLQRIYPVEIKLELFKDTRQLIKTIRKAFIFFGLKDPNFLMRLGRPFVIVTKVTCSLFRMFMCLTSYLTYPFR